MPPLAVVKPATPPVVITGTARVCVPVVWVKSRPARAAPELLPVTVMLVAPPSRETASTRSSPPLMVMPPAMTGSTVLMSRSPCPDLTSAAAVNPPLRVSLLAVPVSASTTLTTASPVPPAPNLSGAVIVAAATFEASAPLVMVSGFAPPTVRPVLAKKSEFTVAAAAGFVTVLVIRMFSVAPTEEKLLAVLYSVETFSSRTPLVPVVTKPVPAA